MKKKQMIDLQTIHLLSDSEAVAYLLELDMKSIYEQIKSSMLIDHGW